MKCRIVFYDFNEDKGIYIENCRSISHADFTLCGPGWFEDWKQKRFSQGFQVGDKHFAPATIIYIKKLED